MTLRGGMPPRPTRRPGSLLTRWLTASQHIRCSALKGLRRAIQLGADPSKLKAGARVRNGWKADVSERFA